MKVHLLLLFLYGIINAFALTDTHEEESMESSDEAVKVLRRSEKKYGSRPRLANRIIRGKVAEEHSYPWMASFRIEGSHFCGGTLIDKEHVLTAARCFNFTEVALRVGLKIDSEDCMLALYRVVLGDHYVKTTEPYEQIFKILRFRVLEPDTKRKNVPLLNDVAVVKLKGVATLNSFVSTIRLASSSIGVAPGDHLTVAGWGSSKQPTHDPENGHIIYPEKFSNVLKEAKTMVILREECGNYYNAIHSSGLLIYVGHPAGEDMICTREENDQGGISFGDFGSPLMQYDKELKEWVQHGICSYRWGRYTENGYSKVSYFRKDIEEMKKELTCSVE